MNRLFILCGMMKRAILFLLFLAITTFTNVYGQCTPVVALSSVPGDTVCVGAPVTFTASVTGGGTTTTYKWVVNGSVVSTTGTMFSYTPADGDSVRFSITTSGPPCTGTTTADSTRHMVVRSSPATPVITGSSAICTGHTLSYTATPSGGTWSSPDANVTVNPTTGVVTGNSAGTATISYAFTNMCGTAVATKIVTVGPLPTITGNTFVYCIGGTTTLSIAATGGTWTSSDPSIATVDPLTGVVTAVAVGFADIGYVITPGFSGCNTRKTVTVLASPLPPSGTSLRICIGMTTSLSHSASGGAWSTSSPNASVDTAGVVTGLAAGTAAITYTLNSSCFTSAVVTVDPTPTGGAITGASMLCTGLSTSLVETVPGGSWNSLNPAVATVGAHTGIVTGVSPGTVQITYSTPPNALNCYGTAAHFITIVAPTFTITPSLTHIKCYGASEGAITVDVTGGNPPFDYYWSGGLSGTSNSGLPAGAYTLTLQETNSRCLGVDSFKLTQPDSMHIVVSTKSDSCGARIGHIKLSVSGGTPPYTYQWTNFTANTTDSLGELVRGAYTVTVTDHNDCKRELRPVIVDLGCTVGIHDVITPNGDGANDKWIIEGLWLYPNNVVQIYDKWGDLVYEKEHYDGDWIGQNKSGSPLPDGTYFYVLKLNDPTLTDNNIYKGLVMIKR